MEKYCCCEKLDDPVTFESLDFLVILSLCKFHILDTEPCLQYMGIMYKWPWGTLHATAEETARQIRGLSYKVFIVT